MALYPDGILLENKAQSAVIDKGACVASLAANSGSFHELKEVVITSLPDRMQIWAKEQMEASNATMTDEEFSQMLEDRLGNIDFE